MWARLKAEMLGVLKVLAILHISYNAVYFHASFATVLNLLTGDANLVISPLLMFSQLVLSTQQTLHI